MAESTGISWCDSTWSPWRGCTPVSPGCDHCYAAALSKRTGGPAYVPGAPRQRTTEAYWRQPARWEQRGFSACAVCSWRGEWPRVKGVMVVPGRCPTCNGMLMPARRKVFPSLCDPFDNEVDPAWRADLFALIADTPSLTWLLLTKRIGNAERMIAEALIALEPGGDLRADQFPWSADQVVKPWPWPNIWLGATIVNQTELERDLWKLGTTSAARRFVSYEPALGPLDFWLPLDATIAKRPTIDWIIAGGESGPGARPAQRDWFRSLRDQCAIAGVPFLFKQWGEWAPGSNWPDDVAIPSGTCDTLEAHDNDRMWKVGRRAAGDLLDGISHHAFPPD